MSWDNDWGYAYEGEWTAAAKRAGVEVVSIQRKMDFSSDWKTEISQLIPKKPDAVFFGYQANSILKQLRQVGLSPKILTTSNVLEELTSGQVAPTLSEGIFYTDWIPHPAFVTRFTAKFGKAPMFNAAEAYEAVRATLAALNANPKEPWAGMKQTKYAGVSGPIDFSGSSNGDLATARLFKVSGGIGRQVE